MPVRSMTGFGTATRPWDTAEGTYALEVEARSVNGRHLEVRVKQPWGPAVEQAIRSLAEARCGRGRIDVTVALRTAAAAATGTDALAAVGVDPSRVQAVVRAVIEARAVALQAGLEVSPPTALELLKFSVAPQRASAEAGLPAPPAFLEALAAEALDGLVAFRVTEGEALRGVLAELVARLRVDVDRVATLVVDQMQPLADRLHRRVRELCEAAKAQPPDETRLAQEVALLAARADVAEELARLAMHLHRMDEVLAAPASSGQGRTLEFIGQELLREFTTIGSKIVSHEGASIVIDAKGTLERIREQVSNVE